MTEFWKERNLSSEDKNKMLVETCRKVFSTDEGKVVLNMLLRDLRLFEWKGGRIKSERYLNEYAKFFVRERLGVSETKLITDFIADTAASEGGL